MLVVPLLKEKLNNEKRGRPPPLQEASFKTFLSTEKLNDAVATPPQIAQSMLKRSSMSKSTSKALVSTFEKHSTYLVYELGYLRSPAPPHVRPHRCGSCGRCNERENGHGSCMANES